MDEIQLLLDGYVKKNLKISLDRLYLPASLGGTGSLEIKKFLTALNLSWFHRAYTYCIDNWRFDLTLKAFDHNLLLTQADDIDRASNPLLHNMAVNYNRFYSSFTSVNGNYKEAYIFKNMAFSFGPDENNLFDEAFFGRETFRQCERTIRNLKFNDLFVEDRVKTVAELSGDGLQLTAACWMRLQLAAFGIRNRLRKPNGTDLIICHISDFLRGIKKGSKKFRNILTHSNIRDSDPNSLRIVNTFSRITGTLIPNVETTRLCLGSWNISFLHNDVRDFLFKFRNNQLLTNERLNAIDGLVSATCTFCRIVGSPDPAPESFIHLFFTCPVVRNLLRLWSNRLEPVPDFNNENGSNFYWYGILEHDEIDNNSKYIIFVYDCFRFLIWKSRCRRKVPNYPAFKRELDFLIFNTLRGSRTFKRKIMNINMLANLLPALG